MNDRYLRDCRLFYTAYPQIMAVANKLELPQQIWRSVTPKLQKTKSSEDKGVNPELLISRLSYTHLLELSKEEETLKRTFYEIQTTKGNWSVRKGKEVACCMNGQACQKIKKSFCISHETKL